MSPPINENEEILPGHPLYHNQYDPKYMEFTMYLKNYNINFTKKKDGFPHMGYKINKIHNILIITLPYT